jgi:hypothetical protein
MAGPLLPAVSVRQAPRLLSPLDREIKGAPNTQEHAPKVLAKRSAFTAGTFWPTPNWKQQLNCVASILVTTLDLPLIEPSRLYANARIVESEQSFAQTLIGFPACAGSIESNAALPRRAMFPKARHFLHIGEGCATVGSAVV